MVEKYKIKLVISIITVLLMIVGAVVAMEEHYVSESEAASSLQSFDQKIATDFQLVKLQILQLRYDNLLKTYFQLKTILKQNPDDDYVREEMNSVKIESVLTKEKIDKILEK